MVTDDEGNPLEEGHFYEDLYRRGIRHYLRVKKISDSSLTLEYPDRRTITINLEDSSRMPFVKLKEDEVRIIAKEHQQTADFFKVHNLEASLSQP